MQWESPAVLMEVCFCIRSFCILTTALLPFPGAEGISEFSFVKLFAGIFTSVPVAAAVLVNRGISFYFLLILSGIFSIVLGRMDRKSKSKMKVKLEKY